LRLKCPLASNNSNRSKSFERPSDSSSAKDKDSLPALSEPTSARKRSAQSGRSLPGWRPPPPREKKDAPPKTTSVYQADVANKLSRGLSSLANQTEESKPIRASNRVIVSAKHRLYSNTATSSASAAGYVYSHYMNPAAAAAAPNGGGTGAGVSYQYGSQLEGGGPSGAGGGGNGYEGGSVWSGRGAGGGLGGAGGVMSGDYDSYDGNLNLLQQQPSGISIASVGSTTGGGGSSR
jgi:hypothetical protein